MRERPLLAVDARHNHRRASKRASKRLWVNKARPAQVRRLRFLFHHWASSLFAPSLACAPQASERAEKTTTILPVCGFCQQTGANVHSRVPTSDWPLLMSLLRLELLSRPPLCPPPGASAPAFRLPGRLHRCRTRACHRPRATPSIGSSSGGGGRRRRRRSCERPLAAGGRRVGPAPGWRAPNTRRNCSPGEPAGHCCCCCCCLVVVLLLLLHENRARAVWPGGGAHLRSRRAGSGVCCDCAFHVR